MPGQIQRETRLYLFTLGYFGSHAHILVIFVQYSTFVIVPSNPAISGFILIIIINRNKDFNRNIDFEPYIGAKT